MTACRFSLPLKLIRFTSNSNQKFSNFTPKLFADQSSFPNYTQFRTLATPSCSPRPSPLNPNPNLRDSDFNTLCALLNNPDLSLGRDLENALDATGIEPAPALLWAVFKQLQSSPKQAFSLFRWAEKRPGHEPSASLFNSMLGVLARAGKFNWALILLLDKIKSGYGFDLVSAESLEILIKHYVRSGKISAAIRIFEFGDSLGMDLFDVLLTSFCKYGHVRVASGYVDRKMRLDPNWVPPVSVYNMLLDGWFTVQKHETAERLWLQMRRKNLISDVSTYGILVEGYCKMGAIDKAIRFLGEMRRSELRPDGTVYNSIVGALARAGRLQEALGMLERFLVLEQGPSLLTYNSLVRGFCEAGDLVGAGKILKMMSSRGVVPTTSTYNYFFRHFNKHGRAEDGVNLYRKMIESGYEIDERTSHLVLKMLCEQEELEFALRISREMRCRGQVLNLAVGMMLINLFCKKQRLKEAVAEFENLIHSGFLPDFVTYRTLHNELKKKGLRDLELKLSDLMAAVPQSKTLPFTVEGLANISRQRRKTIMHRAKAMSDVLKSCSDPRELAKYSKKALEKRHKGDKD